jgi:carboxylesterase
VIVAGLSMGAVLALRLAANHPETTAGLIVLSNAVWLGSPWPTLPLKLIERLRLPDFSLTKSGPDLGDREQRALHLTHNSQPIHAAISLIRGGEATIGELSRVHAPTLILHGARDRVTPVANAWQVAMRLGTTRKRTVIFERSHHILTRDVEREAVRAELLGFLREASSGA